MLGLKMKLMGASGGLGRVLSISVSPDSKVVHSGSTMAITYTIANNTDTDVDISLASFNQQYASLNPSPAFPVALAPGDATSFSVDISPTDSDIGSSILDMSLALLVSGESVIQSVKTRIVVLAADDVYVVNNGATMDNNGFVVINT